jgi:hypothetical protein
MIQTAGTSDNMAANLLPILVRKFSFVLTEKSVLHNNSPFTRTVNQEKSFLKNLTANQEVDD